MAFSRVTAAIFEYFNQKLQACRSNPPRLVETNHGHGHYSYKMEGGMSDNEKVLHNKIIKLEEEIEKLSTENERLTNKVTDLEDQVSTLECDVNAIDILLYRKL